jgi:dUTP pyrophosphatase
MSSVKVRVKQIHPNALIPSYQTTGSSGFDLHADHDAVIQPGKWASICTGLVFEIPEGYEVQIRPRSGLALKQGITVLNSPGTVDSDYRGEVGVILINLGKEPFRVQSGERIAQGVIAGVLKAEFEIASDLSDTQRGEGGFGHSG